MVLSTLRMPILGTSALVSFLLLFPVLGLAQSSEMESLRATVKGMEQQMQKALERIDQLEKEKILPDVGYESVRWKNRFRRVQSAPSALNPAIGMVLDANVSSKS